MTPNTEPIPATDEDVHGILQLILKGYRPIPMTYFKNGGYMDPGQTVDDAMSTVPIEALLARIEQEREMRRELARVAEEVRDAIHDLTGDVDPRSWREVRKLESHLYEILEAALARAAKMEADYGR